ncbi:MAG: DUF2851 family protein [Cytophagales bacterium]|nr:DUF2851 family protein [Cytophagales bacterium]
MKENLLQYVWFKQLFDNQLLKTVGGEELQIFLQGEWNQKSGPDFLNGKIKLNDIEWVGNIEIHLKSSDWYHHKHQEDKAYDNVILHVVWEYDKPVYHQDGKEIPTLVLEDKVEKKLLDQYKTMMETQQKVLCATFGENIETEWREAAIKNALFERLRNKVYEAEQILDSTQRDWQEMAYRWLGRGFGFKDNAEAFLQFTQVLPLKYLQKHRDNILQMEALAFGQAGFLEEPIEEDKYMMALCKEYDFLAKKYTLTPLDKSIWKMGRIRPANFPTLRIAQFVAFLYEHQFVLSTFLETPTIRNFERKFQVVQSPYWERHYTFGKLTEKKVFTLGKSSIENLAMNTAVPLLVAYGKQKSMKEYQQKALHWLENLGAEKNSVITTMKENGFELNSAYKTQGALELYKSYCTQKKCLNCMIGQQLLQKLSQSND